MKSKVRFERQSYYVRVYYNDRLVTLFDPDYWLCKLELLRLSRDCYGLTFIRKDFKTETPIIWIT